MKRAAVVVALISSAVRAEPTEPTLSLFGVVKIEVSRGWDTEVLDGPRLRSTNARQKIALYVVREPDGAQLEPVKDCTPAENGRRDFELDGWRGEEVEMACAAGDYSI